MANLVSNLLNIGIAGKKIYDNRANIGNALKAGIAASSAPTVDDSYLKNLNAQIKALTSQIAARPKLASFDSLANYHRARASAEAQVNPKYELKLNQFLQQNTRQRELKTRAFDLSKEQILGEKTDTLADNTVNRARVAEDTTQAIAKINQGEGIYQVDEGQQFDTEYRQVAEQIAAAGAADTGLGGQQSADAIRLRNVTNKRQLDEFQGQREAKEIFKTRTFEDLVKGDERAGKLAENKTKSAQLDYDQALEDLAWDVTKTTFDYDQQRNQEVFQSTVDAQRVGVEQFLAGLAGQGYSAADIAANRQLYAG